MADEKLPGYNWILQIARAATPTVFMNVACLETNDMDNSNSPIDTTSKCDKGNSSSIPGPNAWTMTGSGFTIDDRGQTAKASFLQMMKIFKLKEEIQIRWAKVDQTIADYYFHGTANITSLKQTADTKDSVKFDVTFTGKGDLQIGGSY